MEPQIYISIPAIDFLLHYPPDYHSIRGKFIGLPQNKLPATILLLTQEQCMCAVKWFNLDIYACCKSDEWPATWPHVIQNLQKKIIKKN